MFRVHYRSQDCWSPTMTNPESAILPVPPTTPPVSETVRTIGRDPTCRRGPMARRPVLSLTFGCFGAGASQRASPVERKASPRR